MPLVLKLVPMVSRKAILSHVHNHRHQQLQEQQITLINRARSVMNL